MASDQTQKESLPSPRGGGGSKNKIKKWKKERTQKKSLSSPRGSKNRKKKFCVETFLISFEENMLMSCQKYNYINGWTNFLSLSVSDKHYD
jgi:hypothetical protein